MSATAREIGGVTEANYAVQAEMVRDIFGNHLRPAADDLNGLRRDDDGTAVKLAQAIYEQRAFDRLPVLPDALENAGCNDAVILGHCRKKGHHVRGCWVVDLLIGKE